MIRQHFFPRNVPIRAPNTHRKQKYNSENAPLPDAPHLSRNYIIIDPEITEPLKEDPPSQTRKHCSVLRQMQSVSLQWKSKPRRKAEEQRFLIDSRRKQICTPVKRELSLVQYSQPRRFSEAENIKPFELGLHDILRTKQNKHRERVVPASMRNKAPSPLEMQHFELKVRGWETSSDDFLDFL
jgi:hypothetical protein